MGSLKRIVMVLISVALFSCASSEFRRSLKNKSYLKRAHNSPVAKRDDSDIVSDSDSGPKLFFKGSALLPVTRVTRRHKSLVLECEAGGSPGPTIHWLKDGARIQQGVSQGYHDEEAFYEDTIGRDGLPLLRLSTTRSKLFIDCISPEIVARFTCVAETPYNRISQSTKIELLSMKVGHFDNCLVKQTLIGDKARVYMWTSTRVEFQDNSVQLFCRATGNPQPHLTWFDAEGEAIRPGHKYQIADNGDLIIKNVNWFDMGLYTCTATNKHGEDMADTFLYPTFRDEEDEIIPPV